MSYSENTLEELKEMLEEQQGKLTTLRMTHTVSPLENPNQLGAARKDVARIKTELRKREIDAAKSNG
jgi:large subunit ribosomal protein L29